MEKKITVYEVSHADKTVVYLTKGEAEKTLAVLTAFGLVASYTTAKRTAIIS